MKVGEIGGVGIVIVIHIFEIGGQVVTEDSETQVIDEGVDKAGAGEGTIAPVNVLSAESPESFHSLVMSCRVYGDSYGR